MNIHFHLPIEPGSAGTVAAITSPTGGSAAGLAGGGGFTENPPVEAGGDGAPVIENPPVGEAASFYAMGVIENPPLEGGADLARLDTGFFENPPLGAELGGSVSVVATGAPAGIENPPVEA